ncbi:hypothetical protein H4S08_002268 [Coemansia sp. RSA 1365]|nr:hypothetical protein H4S08_002268 [Coemansia sp. RSA 1365]
MSYVDSGAFTFKDRLRESAWSNLQFYGIGGVVGLVVIGYVAVTRGVFGADLVAFMMALANFWGLFLVITFMGFGLVAIPRKLWRRGDLELELSTIESQAAAFKDKAYDSELELAEVANEVHLVSARVTDADDLHSYVERVLDHCPHTDSTRQPAQSTIPSSRIPADITEPYLVELHNRIKTAVRRKERDRWRWNRSARRAFFLQDAIKSRGNPSRQIESNLEPWRHWTMARRSAAWWWYLALRPLVFRALAVAAGVLSVAILWSELTFNLASSHFSVVRYMLRTLGLSYIAIELASIIFIAYMCLCAYSSVMKLRIFNVYSLESHHHTNERSLLFCGAYLCRLMFPLCYNFLNMAGSSDASIGGDVTEFSRFMDQIDLVPILGEQSNRAIPVLIMVPATLAFFNVHGRVVEYFSMDSVSRGPRAATHDHDEDTELGPLCLPREEGRSLLLEARRALERMQGASENQTARRYSPASSALSNADSSRYALSTTSPDGNAPAASARGPREWHLGRPSLAHLRDESPSDSSFLSPSLPNYNESRLLSMAKGGRFGSSNDLVGGQSSGVVAPNNNVSPAAASTDAGDSSASNESSDSDSATNNHHRTTGAPLPHTQAMSKPTGMAARFGRWLPTDSRAKASSGKPKPSNATRLRPSSRQSNRSTNVSDDGLSPAFPGTLWNSSAPYYNRSTSRPSAKHYLYNSTTGRPSTRPDRALLLSPSSPGRVSNPWADGSASTRSQLRRHALSESSAQAPANGQGTFTD